MKQVLAIALIILLIEPLAQAAGGGIPWKTIGLQVYNVSIIIIALSWLLKSTVKKHFKERGEEYTDLVSRAERAQKEAEEKHREVKDRLQKLESTATKDLDRIKAEAEEVRHQIISDAKTLAGRLQEEAERAAKFEVEKAIAELRENLLEHSVILARENMSEKLDEKIHQRLASEFNDKIQVVR